ncbi:hypothetical protein AV654_05100 [Paenibacillus elgii]|uniref:Uncharacterized protein n=1 Tax=Paenibacillus elgii TaxID=189691 RepID=A0A163TCS1_9BACL|nr:hypothetical protein [Paenibacillus elgii]KZE71587.1 hypothetical protein AV654_05100 [Paenibacillus elgii]
MMISSLFANNKINDLNESSRELHSALLLAESYHPKQISTDVDGELRFWTAVTNMYGLFYDCMPYFFRTHYQFMRQKYNKQIQTILSVMEQEQALTAVQCKKIAEYFRALTELRSIYCHNKPPGTINAPKLSKVFGSLLWNPYHHDQVSSAGFDFDAAYERFELVTQSIMDFLETGVRALIVKGSERVVLEWQKALIGWFLQSDDLRNRSVHYLRSIYGQVQYPWNINDKIEESLNNSGLTVTDLFEELVDRVDSSATQIHSHEIWRLVISEILV